MCAQEEPEDLSDSSHPAIVPLKDAPPITESHSPAPNYITVHYSKLSRYTQSSSVTFSSSLNYISLSVSLSVSLLPFFHHLSLCRAVHHSSNLLFHVLHVSDFILQLRWLSCFLLYLPVITFFSLSTALPLVFTVFLLWYPTPSLIYEKAINFSSQFWTLKTFQWFWSKMKTCFYDFDRSQMSRWTHMVTVCCWCWFSADQVQVHNLPLGGDKKPKDSSKVVYTLLPQPRHWPGEKRQIRYDTLQLSVSSFTNLRGAVLFWLFCIYFTNFIYYVHGNVSVLWSTHIQDTQNGWGFTIIEQSCAPERKKKSHTKDKKQVWWLFDEEFTCLS